MANAYLNSRRTSIFRAALCTLACAVVSTGVWAQDVSSTTTQKGPTTYETTVRSGTVLYVSGNELLVKYKTVRRSTSLYPPLRRLRSMENR